MAKRDKRIQKKKKRREKIRQSKVRQRSLSEVRDDADFGNQPPDKLESNLFELLANESSTWADEPEFSDITFDPSRAMLAFISQMESHEVDADSFFDEPDSEKRNVLMWKVIGEITPRLVTEKHIAEIVTALQHLEARWAKNKQKSADITGIALVRTMLKEFSSDSESGEALAMIGLLQTLSHRSVMLGFTMEDPFAEADALIEAGDEALFSREIELGLYTETEIKSATEQYVAMKRDEDTSSAPYLAAIVDVVRNAVREPNRAAVMSATITQYIETQQATLSKEYINVLRTMTFFLNENAEDSFDEIERLLVAAMFGEIGRYLEETGQLDLLTDQEE